jgi:major membrane immunogen (membrane-anchored lipoprotein)
MKLISKMLLAFVLVGLTACSSDDDSSSSSCSSNIPFVQTGKSFTYSISQFGFNGGTLKFTYGDCNGNGFLVTRETFDISGGLVQTATDLHKQDGDFLVTDSNNNGDYFAKIYKKNAVVGDIWSVTRPDGSIVTHEVVSVNEQVTVPAGTFTCKVFKYTTTTTVNESLVYWNDEVGNIKEDADGFLLLELLSYN